MQFRLPVNFYDCPASASPVLRFLACATTPGYFSGLLNVYSPPSLQTPLPQPLRRSPCPPALLILPPFPARAAVLSLSPPVALSPPPHRLACCGPGVRTAAGAASAQSRCRATLQHEGAQVQRPGAGEGGRREGPGLQAPYPGLRTVWIPAQPLSPTIPL